MLKTTINKQNKELHKATLKKRKSVICYNKKSELASRAKYGVSRCDGYGFSTKVGRILANALYQYVADGRERIVREDWDTILKHADAIMAYAEADNWDSITAMWDGDRSPIKVMSDYEAKERAFREAMFWLTEEWQTLWW